MLGIVSSLGVLFSAQGGSRGPAGRAGAQGCSGTGLSWCGVLAMLWCGDRRWLEDTARDTAGHCYRCPWGREGREQCQSPGAVEAEPTGSSSHEPGGEQTHIPQALGSPGSLGHPPGTEDPWGCPLPCFALCSAPSACDVLPEVWARCGQGGHEDAKAAPLTSQRRRLLQGTCQPTGSLYPCFRKAVGRAGLRIWAELLQLLLHGEGMCSESSRQGEQ